MTSIDLYEDINEEYDLAMGDREDEEGEDQENQNDDQNPDENAKQEVDASVKVVKAKRKLVTLNAERLKGPRGIIAIDDFYKNIKLKGRGHEKEDLTEIMKRLEHWAHNMFPKYDFDDSLAKIEKLGRKKEIAVHMTRYRLGDLQREQEGLSKEIVSDDEDDKMHENSLANELPIDEFEELINQQIALSTSALPSANFSNMSGISNISSSTQVPKYSQSPQVPNTPSQASQKVYSPPKLTDEQKATIEENRKRAMALRAERLRRQEEIQKREEELRKEELKKQEISQNIISDDHFDD